MANTNLRGATRMASSTASQVTYPFSKTAIILPTPSPLPSMGLRLGKGLMPHLRKTLPTPEKQKLLSTLFSKRHPDRLVPGSVLSVSSEHAPTNFSGVLLGIRRRGPDTSFLLRNVIQRTGVEMQFFASSPHLKEIKVVQRAGGAKRKQRAKLFYLRDSPEKMSMISAGAKK